MRKYFNTKFSGKQRSILARAVGIATALSLSVAQAGMINLNEQENIAFTVNNLSDVSGFGIHFSTTAFTDGYGGSHAECHLISGSVSEPKNEVKVWCTDGHTGGQSYHNEFYIPLGAKQRGSDSDQQEVLSSITLIVTKQGVKVKAERLAYTAFSTEVVPFTVESFFPMRENTGFWRTGEIHYSENGVLNGRSGREGSGYVVSVAENVETENSSGNETQCQQTELDLAYNNGYSKGQADGSLSCGTGNYPNPTYKFDPDRNTGVLSLPSIDFQLLNPFFPEWSTQTDAYSAELELMPGTGYFRITEANSKQPPAK
ncbi:hypothetical protein QUF74_01055 [Candidatus Halobeggiatoa sp. HSG11]|nr:hypothetical protein [Candidatus Halobeggiatoa sp. HSG11]